MDKYVLSSNADGDGAAEILELSEHHELVSPELQEEFHVDESLHDLSNAEISEMLDNDAELSQILHDEAVEKYYDIDGNEGMENEELTVDDLIPIEQVSHEPQVLVIHADDDDEEEFMQHEEPVVQESNIPAYISTLDDSFASNALKPSEPMKPLNNPKPLGGLAPLGMNPMSLNSLDRPSEPRGRGGLAPLAPLQPSNTQHHHHHKKGKKEKNKTKIAELPDMKQPVHKSKHAAKESFNRNQEHVLPIGLSFATTFDSPTVRKSESLLRPTDSYKEELEMTSFNGDNEYSTIELKIHDDTKTKEFEAIEIKDDVQNDIAQYTEHAQVSTKNVKENNEEEQDDYEVVYEPMRAPDGGAFQSKAFQDLKIKHSDTIQSLLAEHKEQALHYRKEFSKQRAEHAQRYVKMQREEGDMWLMRFEDESAKWLEMFRTNLTEYKAIQYGQWNEKSCKHKGCNMFDQGDCRKAHVILCQESSDMKSQNSCVWYRMALNVMNGRVPTPQGLVVYSFREKSLEYLNKAAELGHARAMTDLGISLWKGRGAEKNLEQAFQWFQKAACSGEKVGQYYMGVAYRDGTISVEKDDDEAMAWFKRSAKQGFPNAQYAVAMMYKGGFIIPKSKFNDIVKPTKEHIQTRQYAMLVAAMDKGHAAARSEFESVFAPQLASQDEDELEEAKRRNLWITEGISDATAELLKHQDLLDEEFDDDELLALEAEGFDDAELEAMALEMELEGI